MSKHVRAYERSSAQYHEKDSPQKLITEHVRETTRVSYAEDDREQTNKILEIERERERERESLRNPPERGGGPPSLMEEASARASLAMKRAGAETARRLSRDLREDEEEEEEEED